MYAASWRLKLPFCPNILLFIASLPIKETPDSYCLRTHILCIADIVSSLFPFFSIRSQLGVTFLSGLWGFISVTALPFFTSAAWESPNQLRMTWSPRIRAVTPVEPLRQRYNKVHYDSIIFHSRKQKKKTVCIQVCLVPYVLFNFW